MPLILILKGDTNDLKVSELNKYTNTVTLEMHNHEIDSAVAHLERRLSVDELKEIVAFLSNQIEKNTATQNS